MVVNLAMTIKGCLVDPYVSKVNAQVHKRQVKKINHCSTPTQACPEVLYQPGDAFGFVCPNPTEEVDYVLQR